MAPFLGNYLVIENILARPGAAARMRFIPHGSLRSTVAQACRAGIPMIGPSARSYETMVQQDSSARGSPEGCSHCPRDPPAARFGSGKPSGGKCYRLPVMLKRRQAGGHAPGGTSRDGGIVQAASEALAPSMTRLCIWSVCRASGTSNSDLADHGRFNLSR